MDNQKLFAYLRQQLQNGKTKEQITQELINAGWKQEDINNGFASLNSPSNTPTSENHTMGPLPSINSLFSESFELLKKRIMVMFLSYLFPFLALIATILVAGVLTFGIYKANSIAGIIAGVILGLTIFAAYFYTIVLATASQLVALRDSHENTGTIENLKRSRLVMWNVFLVGLIQGLVVMGGFILLVIPGLILMVWYGFSSVIMVTEGKKGRSALAQSKAYVNGRSWHVFGRVILLYLVCFIPYIILQIVGAMNKGNPVVTVIVVILSVIIQIFFTFYNLAFLYTLYIQLKNTSSQTNHEQYIGGVTGWTIWGSIGGVLVILGLLASVVLISLNGARVKSRDAKRMAHVRQIASSLEFYYKDNNTYPNQLNSLTPNYINAIPEPPKPADGGCTALENQYSYKILDAGHYDLSFCLGTDISGYQKGVHLMTESGIDPEMEESSDLQPSTLKEYYY